MATIFLLLSGQFLLISPDITKTLASTKTLKATKTASETLNNQTYLMKTENDQPMQYKNIAFGDSNLSSSIEKPQSPEEYDNISCLATNKTTFSMELRKSRNMTNKTGLFEDVDSKGLDCNKTNDSPEERATPLFEGNATYHTLKQHNKEPFSTTTSDVSSTPHMNTVDPDPIMTFTCQNRCSMEISFPCSCSASCVVYGTCCDNITHDCPHVWEEGLTRFKHILQSDIICYENFIFMVSSCPRKPKKSAEQKGTSLPTTGKRSLEKVTIGLENQSAIFDDVGIKPGTSQVTGFISENVSLSNRDNQESIVERLKKALSEAPVTDSDTGLTFINKSIYDCNKMPQSTAVVWSVESTYNSISPTKMEVFESLDIVNQYEIEFNIQILKAHQCEQKVIETCDQTWDQNERYEEYTDKCQKTFALILSKYPKPVFYRNIFCAYCNQGIHNDYEFHLSDKSVFKRQKFKILMSFSKHGTISVKLSQPSASRDIFPWSHAQCLIPASDNLSISSDINKKSASVESDKRAVCSVTCHGSFFKAQSDGLCKTRHTALLAIADDGLPPLCPAAMNSLAKFLVCGLKSEVASLSYADIDSQPVSVMFDASVNKSLYVVKINLALINITGGLFSSHHGDTFKNIYHVALLVKSFQNYRSSHDLCSRQSEEYTKNNPELRIIRTLSLDHYVSMTQATRSLAQGMEELRGPLEDKQNTTTVCLTTVYRRTEVDPSLLRCTEDPLYKLDTTLVNDFRRCLRCFSHLDNPEVSDKNEADTVIKNGSFLNEVLALITLSLAIIEIIKI
ncbi:hypothetical protein PoB_002244200 [Plakobranchus ocellatus]|uniref:SMB domain-containing protein n=1 Tax=Plakobranchus ocellatus TaxID=259542 RepID=A0AAV3ZMQ0_9GAST|nr:hypothetical protein PoB_002244200 [Plakobranchus ocellatus]